MKQNQRPAKRGSPWYYRDGGKRLPLKEIRQSVRTADLMDIMARKIVAADRLAEPQRTQALDDLRTKAKAKLGKALSGYRYSVRELNAYRAVYPEAPQGQTICADAHNGIYVATCYLRFAFATLRALEGTAPQQLSLF